MLWVKAFHIIMMTCWFAGLFYLPRLFVYHASVAPTEEMAYARFCLMERRLFWGIMTPSAVFTLLLGLGLKHFLRLSFLAPPLWFLLKLLFVGGTIGYHIVCGYLITQFQGRRNRFSPRFYRFFNEIVLLLLSGVVLLTVLKPL